MLRRNLALAAIAMTAAVIFGAACGDDNDKSADSAVNTTSSLEQFKATLASTTNIVSASDETRNTLKDKCGDLQDDVDSGTLDDVCDDLTAAVNNKDQVKFDAAKQRFAGAEADIRAEIAKKIADAAD